MRRHPDWDSNTLHAERRGVLQEVGKQPDIVVAPPRRQPVAVETEFAPAPTVEKDALSRLGAKMRGTGTPIEGVLSVVLPAELRTGDVDAVETAKLRYATHYLDAHGNQARWPVKGWLDGTADDLADAIEYLSLSERQLATGTETMMTEVRNAAALLAEHASPSALAKIAQSLHQEPSEQTERMAAAICLSAFVFHAAIEGQDDIPAVPLPDEITKASLLQTWKDILAINYWPIFSIARELVTKLPVKAVPPIAGRLADAVQSLAQLGATTYHDLAGRMFQTLIADRKFLATFYTLPESACLLAELAVERLKVDWSDRSAIEELRVADMACGTGALLSATQRAIYRRHRRTGGDDKDLHQAMMEQTLIGLDIMPAATHLTCSMLSSAHPSLGYGESQIHTMPYGDDAGQPHIGSLDLLSAEVSYSLFATGVSMAGAKVKKADLHSMRVDDGSCDLVIMNPPFTRPTNHEAAHADVPVPSFAGFGREEDEQKAMSRKLRRVDAEFGHGNAGLASNFMDLGHRKLKPGGVLALVLPFSFAQGRSWDKARAHLASGYSDAHVVSLAAHGSTERAFSADTGMAECLLVATKGSAQGSERARFSNLSARPGSLLEAASMARRVRRTAWQGSILHAQMAGVRSRSVVDAAQGLCAGELRLPRQARSVPIAVKLLGQVAGRGPVHRDINGTEGSPSRGPFDVRAVPANEIPTYPVLWAHHAQRERSLVVEPDMDGLPRSGSEGRAADLWRDAASRLHSTLDFQVNAQSLAMCRTPQRSLGGRAWPNVLPHDRAHEIPLLLWSNTTLGLILFWWRGTRQQKGRANTTISALPSLPVLDPGALTKRQIRRCEAIYEELKTKPLLPANEAYRDDNRKGLDCAVLFDVLKLNSELKEGVDVLRQQWCSEPSVHGGKPTRPGQP